MSKAVYALRILVETGENMETVESHIRGWGEATFEGFILLELTRTRESLAGIDTLSHAIAQMVKRQETTLAALETTQGGLERTIDTFDNVVGVMKQLVGVLSGAKRPDEVTTEEDKAEEVQDEVAVEEV